MTTGIIWCFKMLDVKGDSIIILKPDDNALYSTSRLIKAEQAIKNGIAFLASSAFACRKAGNSSFIRELIIALGHAGYVALFEIVDSNTVIIGAIRHQLEDDYY
jgi:hypothetical protein